MKLGSHLFGKRAHALLLDAAALAWSVSRGSSGLQVEGGEVYSVSEAPYPHSIVLTLERVNSQLNSVEIRHRYTNSKLFEQAPIRIYLSLLALPISTCEVTVARAQKCLASPESAFCCECHESFRELRVNNSQSQRHHLTSSSQLTF